MKSQSNLCTVSIPILDHTDVILSRTHRDYLPHLTSPHLVQHIILHLSDALPTPVLDRFKREVAHLQESEAKRRLIEKIEAWSDAGHGCCELRDPGNADIMQNSLLFNHEIRYRLFAWVIMPNHLHILLQQLPGWSLNQIVATLKKRTARQIHMRNPSCPQPLWQREFWDRYTRNRKHFRNIVEYIHQNPVKAGLVKTAEEWKWSTARAWAEFKS